MSDEAKPVRAGDELDVTALQAFVDKELGAHGNVVVEQFPGGHSNLTYLVHHGDREYVLRRPPFGSKVKSAHDMGREVAVLSKLAPVYSRAPRVLAFHNEPDHMKPIEGQIPYDLFMDRTDRTVVRHQLDVGNMALGGGDPMRYLERYRDRYWSFHLKDVVADRSRDTELGTGVLDLRRIVAAIPDIGTKPCYVEQEGSADSLASARRNFEFLRRLG